MPVFLILSFWCHACGALELIAGEMASCYLVTLIAEDSCSRAAATFPHIQARGWRWWMQSLRVLRDRGCFLWACFWLVTCFFSFSTKSQLFLQVHSSFAVTIKTKFKFLFLWVFFFRLHWFDVGQLSDWSTDCEDQSIQVLHSIPVSLTLWCVFALPPWLQV